MTDSYRCPDLSQEKKNADVFGEMYSGYFTIRSGVRHIGYIGVVKKFRGKGYFRKYLEEVKEGVKGVILYNPVLVTIIVAEKLGYEYDEDREICIWRRDNEDA